MQSPEYVVTQPYPSFLGATMGSRRRRRIGDIRFLRGAI